jgi:hypothetical protein
LTRVDDAAKRRRYEFHPQEQLSRIRALSGTELETFEFAAEHSEDKTLDGSIGKEASTVQLRISKSRARRIDATANAA